MGLRQTISEWVTIIKDALDFGPEFPAAMEARHVMFAQESARLQHLLEQTRKASQEKDELITRLRTAGAIIGNMIVDGPAYYIKKANTLEGPFCTACFQRNHEIVRLAPAPAPKDTGESSADWVQCGRCKTPFRSERIRQYLDPGKGTGPDDKRKTEDRRQKTELRSQPSPDQAPEPNSPRAPDSAPGSPSPKAMPSVEASKPVVAQTTVSPEANDVPRRVKAARTPRRSPKRDASHLGGAPTGETGPAGEDPQSARVATASPSRTPPRARKPRSRRPDPARKAAEQPPT